MNVGFTQLSRSFHDQGIERGFGTEGMNEDITYDIYTLQIHENCNLETAEILL